MKKSENNTLVAFRWKKESLKHLKTLTRQESVRRDRDLTYSDLIREALEKTYPLPK